jgi:hypothetical protein
MELKLFNLTRASEQDRKTDDEEFVLELTLEELSAVAGGARHDDEAPKHA